MVLQAIRYTRGELEILDQPRLPHEEVYIEIQSPQDAWDAIQSMQVRGAPAIAIVAALSLAVYLARSNDTNGSHRANCPNFVSQSLKYLVTSRPTAVNLADAARKLEKLVYAADAQSASSWSSVSEAYILAAESMLVDDVQDNKNIGKYGAEWILRHSDITSSSTKLSVLTHCNTGSLATAGYGTALGVIRNLHARGVLDRAFYTETRPYNQGSRLTGYELTHDEIPATLVTDSMAAALLNLKKHSENISCIVVGADRVAANGDTANKIGTYSLAILARFHNVKFLVAAPRTTIDLSTASGADITIEERSPSEVTLLKGPRAERRKDGSIAVDVSDIREISTAASMTISWNPAFDVTPAELIDGIVTEKGVVEKSSDMRFHFESMFTADESLAHQRNGDASNILATPDGQLNNVPQANLSWDAVLSLKPSQVPDWETWIGERRR